MLKHFPDIHSDMVNSVEFSRDGKLLVSGGADKFARVTDRETGKQLHAFEGIPVSFLGLVCKPTGGLWPAWERTGGQGLEFGQWRPGGKQSGYKERDHLHPFHRLD